MMLLPFAFSSSLSAFVAQNVGANEHARARKAMLYGMAAAAAAGLLVFAVVFFSAARSRACSRRKRPSRRLANTSEPTPSTARLWRFICVWSLFQRYGKTLFTMLQGIFCAFFIRIPFACL
jgi:Na+-driven multidrug efflux pump